MTKDEFIKLNPTRTTMLKLRNLALEKYRAKDESHIFYSEVSRIIQEYIQLPQSIRKAVTKPNLNDLYNFYIEVKKLGYKKNLQMPF